MVRFTAGEALMSSQPNLQIHCGNFASNNATTRVFLVSHIDVTIDLRFKVLTRTMQRSAGHGFTHETHTPIKCAAATNTQNGTWLKLNNVLKTLATLACTCNYFYPGECSKLFRWLVSPFTYYLLLQLKVQSRKLTYKSSVRIAKALERFKSDIQRDSNTVSLLSMLAQSRSHCAIHCETCPAGGSAHISSQQENGK